MTQQGWTWAWQQFDGIYTPHTEDLQHLIQQHAQKFELAYNDLDEVEEQERFIGLCYTMAKKHKLPLSLVDWWRKLQVHWVAGEDNDPKYPGSLPYYPIYTIRFQAGTLQAFRIALHEGDEVEIMFLASMLEAIRLGHAQRLIWGYHPDDRMPRQN